MGISPVGYTELRCIPPGQSPPIFGAGLNGGLFSETMDFRDLPSVISAVRIAQS